MGKSQVSSLWQRMRLLLILPLLAVAIAQKRSYDGHQVLRVGPLDDESYFVLRDLQMTSNALDFWTEPAPGRTTDINIPPEGLASVKAWLEEKGISYSIMIEDLGPLSESNQPKKTLGLCAKGGKQVRNGLGGLPRPQHPQRLHRRPGRRQRVGQHHPHRRELRGQEDECACHHEGRTRRSQHLAGVGHSCKGVDLTSCGNFHREGTRRRLRRAPKLHRQHQLVLPSLSKP